MSERAVCPVVERVREELRVRALHGLAKYGQTMERPDYDLRAWLQNAKEEAMDLVIYLERILMLLDGEKL
jgi:hypothetical protein